MNFWSKEPEEMSEYDLLEDAKETEQIAQEYADQPTIEEASEEEIVEIIDNSSFKLDRRESNVIYNARLRLEQARLYEMLINHNLFEGVEASQRAIENVQSEIKHYIVARLEILLGLREKTVKNQEFDAEKDFNNKEVGFLRELAYKGTLGSSRDIGNVKPTSNLKPVAEPKKQTQLKSLGQKPTERVIERPVQAEPVRQQQPVIKNKKVVKQEPKIKSGTIAPRNLSKAEIEELAIRDLQETADKKPFHKMSAKEKAVEIRRVNEKHKSKAKPRTAAPIMSDVGQLQQKYLTEQMTRSNSGASQQGTFNQILATALANKKLSED